ncbi:LysR family transcriptional regulator [uncultured Vibrio sp.]|uniref:LysR family transcriptional regulator n=1 Tax=uncultured Vibrio sp. TaxID=114054 RepID=UPI00261CF59B|nr:LysR family transcriptional regulator [uncultured Vibrio sp.]
MNLMHLRTFLNVAQLGGFSAAAELLDISKGMVSRHIRSLEDSLQCQLFNRTTRSVTLTEPGFELLEKAQEIEKLANQAQLNIYGLVQEAFGKVKLTAPSALGRIICKEVIRGYVEEYPKVNLSLSFSRKINDVEFGQFDIAIRAYDSLPDNLVAKELGYVKNILVASPKWVQDNPVEDVADLRQYDAINDNNQTDWNVWNLQTKSGEKETIETLSKIACSDYSDSLLMTKLGLGVANLPRYVVEEDLKNGSLVHILPEWYSSIHRLYLAYTKLRSYPKKVTGLTHLILQWRETHPEWFLDSSESHHR